MTRTRPRAGDLRGLTVSWTPTPARAELAAWDRLVTATPGSRRHPAVGLGPGAGVRGLPRRLPLRPARRRADRRRPGAAAAPPRPRADRLRVLRPGARRGGATRGRRPSEHWPSALARLPGVRMLFVQPAEGTDDAPDDAGGARVPAVVGGHRSGGVDAPGPRPQRRRDPEGLPAAAALVDPPVARGRGHRAARGRGRRPDPRRPAAQGRRLAGVLAAGAAGVPPAHVRRARPHRQRGAVHRRGARRPGDRGPGDDVRDDGARPPLRLRPERAGRPAQRSRAPRAGRSSAGPEGRATAGSTSAGSASRRSARSSTASRAQATGPARTPRSSSTGASPSAIRGRWS